MFDLFFFLFEHLRPYKSDFSCKRFDLVLDLGSNIGYYSLLASSRGYDVISFEASPDTAWLQRSSAPLNGWLVSPEYYYYYESKNARYVCITDQNSVGVDFSISEYIDTYRSPISYQGVLHKIEHDHGFGKLFTQ